MLAGLKLNKKILVGNSDAGSYFNTKVLAAVDYGVSSDPRLPTLNSIDTLHQLSNVHPWFANTTIQDASSWTMKFFQETNVQPASLLPNKVSHHDIDSGISFDIAACSPICTLLRLGGHLYATILLRYVNDTDNYYVFDLGVLRRFQREQRWFRRIGCQSSNLPGYLCMPG
jgi:hypothetical protein